MTGDAGGCPEGAGAEDRELSSRRAVLASFDHAYAVALHLKRESGRCQFIARTNDPVQPFRTASLPPRLPATLIAIIA
jgi:hypothetical protein